jgi:methylthioribulose-1-phosphate dehydratase
MELGGMSRQVLGLHDSSEALARLATELVEAGRWLAGRGWVPATSGNLSARISPDRIAITVSGRHKGRLVSQDIMVVDSEGRSLDGKRPSAETPLHTSIYRHFPEVASVLHVHSVNATLISRRRKGSLLLEGYELLKAFRGIDTHETCVSVPIFPNDQDIPRLARAVEAYLDRSAPVYGYLIEGHGLYAWGASVGEALRHVEAFDFLFECELRQEGLPQP